MADRGFMKTHYLTRVLGLLNASGSISPQATLLIQAMKKLTIKELQTLGDAIAALKGGTDGGTRRW